MIASAKAISKVKATVKAITRAITVGKPAP